MPNSFSSSISPKPFLSRDTRPLIGIGLYPGRDIAVTQTKIYESTHTLTLNRSSHIDHGTDDLFPFIHPNIRFRVNNTGPLPVPAKSSPKPPKSKNKKRRRNQRVEHTNGCFTIDDSSRLPINDPALSEGYSPPLHVPLSSLYDLSASFPPYVGGYFKQRLITDESRAYELITWRLEESRVDIMGAFGIVGISSV